MTFHTVNDAINKQTTALRRLHTAPTPPPEPLRTRSCLFSTFHNMTYTSCAIPQHARHARGVGLHVCTRAPASRTAHDVGNICKAPRGAPLDQWRRCRPLGGSRSRFGLPIPIAAWQWPDSSSNAAQHARTHSRATSAPRTSPPVAPTRAMVRLVCTRDPSSLGARHNQRRLCTRAAVPTNATSHCAVHEHSAHVQG